MKLPRARGYVVAAAILGSSVTLASLPLSAGAASSTLKPAGAAFVHVGGEGQTAYSVKVKSSTYKIKAPADVAIDWVGAVTGKGERSGTYTPKQLAKAWTALGHRPRAGVQSTITWYAAGSETMSFRSAKVSHPRVNGKGELVFTATLNGASTSGLPSVLPEFGINISRAESSSRAYPIYWSVETITSGFGYQASTGGDASGSVTWQSNSGSGWATCPGTTISASGTSDATFKLAAQVTCNGYTLYTDKTLVSYSLVDGANNDWTMLPCWHATWGTSSKSIACSPVEFEWTKGGN